MRGTSIRKLLCGLVPIYQSATVGTALNSDSQEVDGSIARKMLCHAGSDNQVQDNERDRCRSPIKND